MVKHQIDARGETLGRLATKVANLLRGKHKAGFTYHQDHGDEVVILNPGEIQVTGGKAAKKKYYRHSGYPGGLRTTTLAELLEARPEQVIIAAVRNMLPANRLRRGWLKRLKFNINEN